MNNYHVVAKNYSESSENRIHSDEIAKKYGFRGALVPGVAVYGHMTFPLVQLLGEDWLAHSSNSLRLLKPTYDGERMSIDCNDDHGTYQVESRDEQGELTAVLTSQQPRELPPLEDLNILEGDFKNPERVEISWDTVVPNQPFAPWQVTLTGEENARYTREVDDTLSVYQNGLVHPHLLLSLANTALMNEYFMPTWIHASSETRHRRLLRVDDTITIKSVPLEKWRKKGHEFIRLYVTYWRDDEITTDIFHTAIFKLAE
jgi:acyl dehydratase